MRQHGSFCEVWEGWREVGVWRVAICHGKGVERVEGHWVMGLLEGQTLRRRRWGEGAGSWVVALREDGRCCM